MPSFSSPSTSVVILTSLLPLSHAIITKTFTYGNLPNQVYDGIMTGFNNCSQWLPSNQNADCETIVVNSNEDFCLFAPPYSDGHNATIANTEREEVAWCTKPGYGTRLLPNNIFQGLHFVKTDRYIQLTGVGDFTKIGIPAGDTGGELDAHGFDGKGNPIGGMCFTDAFSSNGALQEAHEWIQFISATQFCMKVCQDGPNAEEDCNHIYDEMGCFFAVPGSYDAGVFESCESAPIDPPGVVVDPTTNTTSTFTQGNPITPPAKPAPSSSNCQTTSVLYNNPNILPFDGSTVRDAGSSVSTTAATSTPGTQTTTSAKTQPTSKGSNSSSGSGSKSGSGSSTSSGSSPKGTSTTTGGNSLDNQPSGSNKLFASGVGSLVMVLAGLLLA